MGIIKIYMKEIEQFKRLSEEEELHLADIIESGTEEEKNSAVNELVVHNLRLVVKIANDFTRDKTVDFEDLVSQGNIGLMRAARKFRRGCGAKFSTHAAWWIKQSIKRYIDGKDLIRIPSAYNQKIKKVHRIKTEFESINGREPTDQELSELTGYSEEEISKIKLRHNRFASLDIEIGDEGSLHDVLAEYIDEPYWTAEREELLERVYDVINHLEENERYIIIKRFGLDGCQPEKLEDISAKVGKSAERVRQIQNELIIRIRSILKDDE